MAAKLIDGKAFATQLQERLSRDVERLKRDHGLTPGLAVIMVGSDPASAVYVRNKGQQTRAIGMASFSHHLRRKQAKPICWHWSLSSTWIRMFTGFLCSFPCPPKWIRKGCSPQSHRKRTWTVSMS